MLTTEDEVLEDKELKYDPIKSIKTSPNIIDEKSLKQLKKEGCLSIYGGFCLNFVKIQRKY